MKAGLTIFLICSCIGTSWSQSDSTKMSAPLMMHISSSSIGSVDSLSIADNFNVLSLVSKDLFDNWNVADLKQKYGKKGALIVVARQDTDTKTKFVTSFYQHWVTTGSRQRAYELAINDLGTSEEIKHILIVNE